MKPTSAFALLLAMFAIAPVTHAMDVYVQVTHPARCIYGGRIQGSIVGGIPPYQVTLSTGQQIVSNYSEFVIENVPAGVQQAVVTDAMAVQATANFDVGWYNSLTEFQPHFTYPLPWCGSGPHYAISASNGIYDDSYSGGIPGIPPLTIESPSYSLPAGCWGGNILVEFPPGPPLTYPTINYTDANGCQGILNTLIVNPTTLPSIGFLNVNGSCSNRPTGSVTIGISGGVPWQCNITFDIYRANGVPLYSTCGGGYSTLPTNLTFQDLAAGNYFLRVQAMHLFSSTGDWLQLFLEPSCLEDHPFTIPAFANCAVVAGKAFVDANSNCTRQTNEIGVPGAIMEITPGPLYGESNSFGDYGVVLPSSGPYSLRILHPAVAASCGDPIAFNATSGQTTTVNVPTQSTVPLDVSVALASGAARPGFQLRYGLALKNLSPQSSGGITLTMQFDPNLTFSNASPAPISVVGNVITWSIASLTGWSQPNYTIYFQVPADVGLIGTQLMTTATAVTANTDGNLMNNTAVSSLIVTGSYDPNDKSAITSTGSRQTWTIGSDEYIDYTIRFQNTGTDTAFYVMITDSLPVNLDPGSIIIGAASHAFSWQLRGQGTLKFIFENILLPHTAVNEPASHGFVSFRIKPKQQVVPGSSFTNRANIFFDYNPPIITDPSVLTVPSPGIAVSPKVMLGGPYVQATQLMTDGLRSGGLIPFTEPYMQLGYTHVNGGGGETTTGGALTVTGNNAIVDWVVVELRNTTSPYAVVATKSALVQRDGDVVATNGTGPVLFNRPAGNYRVAIRHRNHLGVMTNTSRALSTTTTVVDFSVTTTATYGTNAQATVGTRRVLWAGDCRGDGNLKYTGINNDRDLILVRIGGAIASNTTTGYFRDDVNMDGTVKYTGNNNDRDPILVNIGGSIATNVVLQQLP